ncbi:LacI family DNA-binding transcriptional regulator [Mucilaginibacter paludis]|uniref:Transcriptional regulator, LacI family n=1 Tax=Mucilaginibacter paludis DSM 18603 TaxID=714943 RepID=H1Y282_9SPHI|nr:LacI family DNA-binding transcriptional regulator [Mucilaginibacter paludis]EHQ26739.1 transcriptional regulator, LacI family [Mucilaginibacter paludis DSM 18603]
MFEPITIKDIAKALGLSTSTVSRALRGGYEISAETKKLVLEYAEKINYHPNPIALSLKERRSHSIGVVVCEVANNYFSQAINGIESIAYSRGYHVIITQTHESSEREVVNVQHLASRSVDGLLISLSSETQDLSHLKYLHEKGLPMVFFDRVTNDIDTHKVIANNYEGAFSATEHLIKAGFRRIGHLTSSPQLSISIERLEGYKAALAKYKIPFNPDYLQNCMHGGMIQEEVEVAVKRLITLPDRPDSVFVAGDRLSTGCLISLKKHGLKVPSDISMAGFTNSDYAELFSPALTTVRQPAFKIGQIATEMLIQLIESKYPVTEFETRMLDTELFIRESSEFDVSVEN